MVIAADLEPLAVPIGKLQPDPDNARAHDKGSLASIVASLKRYGQRKPIVANRSNGQIEAGHGIWLAAKRLRWKRVAVVWVEDDPKTQRGFNLADNRTAELSAWDEAKLERLLRELKEDEPDAFELMWRGHELGIVGTEMPALPDGDRELFQQMTFTLSDDQAESVKRALAKAKAAGPFVDTGNENSNGNALARIAEAYLGTG